MTTMTYAVITIDLKKNAREHEHGSLRASYGFSDATLDASAWRAQDVWPEATKTQLRFAAASLLRIENAGFNGIMQPDHGDFLAGAFAFGKTPQWVASAVIDAFTTAQQSRKG